MVVLPVMMARALDTRTLCRSMFVIVDTIAIAIAVDAPTLLLANVVRAASGVAQGDLAFCPLGMTFVLTSANFIVKLVLELELSLFFNALNLHTFERTIVLLCHELGFKKLSDQFEGLGIKFSAQHNKLVTVVLMKRHIEPLKC
jgi:hypothetical protein